MDAKKKKILWLELAGFMFTLVAGTVMHFGLELSGFCPQLGMAVPGERKSLGTFKAQLLSDCFLGPDPVCNPAAATGP